jgi:ABC-type transport system involved in multi-copper enzyme maturation permease subunit
VATSVRVAGERAEASRFVRLVRLELFKLRRRPMPWVMVGVLAVLTFAIPLLFHVTLRVSSADAGSVAGDNQSALLERLVYPGVVRASVENALSFGMPLLIVLSAASFGGEFAWGTVRLHLGRGMGRGEYVAAKLAAIVLWWGAMLAIAVVGAFLAAGLIGVVGDSHGLAGFGVGDLPPLLGRLAVAWWASSVYAAFTALSTVQFRSTAFGLAMGLAGFFGEQAFAGAAASIGLMPLELLAKSGLIYNVRSLLGTLDGHENPAWLAAFAIVAYSLCGTFGAVNFLRRRDVVVAGVG